jgi:hypothetical protein
MSDAPVNASVNTDAAAAPFEPPYQGWRPYCLVCPTILRMKAEPFGWSCVACHNTINHQLEHHDV